MTVTIDARAPSAALAPGRVSQPSPPEAGPQHDQPSQRLAGADALRAFAVLGVIVVHTTHWARQDTGADQAVWYSTTLLARFCVPAFVVLSGLVLAHRYGAQRLGGAFLLRRARRSVLPWLVWAPLFCLFDLLLTGEVGRTWGHMGDWWSLGGGHLYYLILVPQLYLLMLVWPSRRRNAVALAVVLLGVQVALDTYRLYTPIGGGALHQVAVTHAFEEFPFWIGFFAVGVAAGLALRGRRGRGVPAWPFVVAVPPAATLLLWVDRTGMASPAEATGTGSFLRPLIVPFVLAVCGALVFGAPSLLQRMPRLHRATDVVSRHSLGIYVVHPMLLAGFGRLLAHRLHSHLPMSIAAVIALTVATGLSALLVSVLLARTPLALTIGEERRGRRQPQRESERELIGRAA